MNWHLATTDNARSLREALVLSVSLVRRECGYVSCLAADRFRAG